MEAIAKEHNRERKEMFRPLIVADRYLTKHVVGDILETWKKSVKELYASLTDPAEKNFICLFFAIMYYKYDYEIEAKNRPPVDDFIKETDMDDSIFYRYYYNEEMRRQIQISKNLELMDTKIKALRKIADNENTKEQNKILAWRDITEHIIKQIRALDANINVYTGQAIIAQNNGQLRGVDVTRLLGQGSKEFRSKLKELDEINTIENVSD